MYAVRTNLWRRDQWPDRRISPFSIIFLRLTFTIQSLVRRQARRAKTQVRPPMEELYNNATNGKDVAGPAVPTFWSTLGFLRFSFSDASERNASVATE